MQTRLLNQAEEAIARQVFENELPYKKIRLADYYLPGNKGVPVTLAAGAGLLPFLRSLTRYTIYFGPVAFADGADAPDFRNTLIHELTHVWQGHHSHFAWEYMVKSMLSQGHALLTTGDRNNAYTYKPGKSWDDYNVEQQASIVADWFADGMRGQDVDDRFTYIVNNIRAGHN